MDITDLPRDVFLLVVAHLSARTAVLCRRVSKHWHAVFTGQDLSLQLLKWHFPRCREMRTAYAASDGNIPGSGRGGNGVAGVVREADHLPGPALGGAGDDDDDDDDDQAPSWTLVFATVARRYHHLGSAAPRSIEKIRLGTSGPHQDRFYGVATWDRHLRLDDKTAPFHHPDPSWCYGDDGVLVYHAHPGDAGEDVAAARIHVYPWRLLDLESGEAQEVPFPHDDDRVVRRVRLVDGVLAFEWCESTAYHQLNDREECHRHYVTVLDVVRIATRLYPATNNTTYTNSGTWEITPRAEFKFHLLGLHINAHDRFLSAHTRTHYAVYVWQSNRSPWGEDEPIESAIVWDITRSPPRIIRRMAWAALAFYGIRQGRTPRLRCLGLDERNLYLAEEEHRWACGSHSSLSPPRVHLVRSTGIPILPSPAGESCLQGMAVETAEGVGEGQDEVVIQGPRWLDECGANGDVNLSFCSRVMGTHLSTTSTTSADASVGAGMIWNDSLVSAATPAATSSAPTLAQELGAAVRAPVGRWPGWAPCWRHEEFPYLTVGEVVDFRAGVRIAARHCFMLETLSVHVRPSLSLSVRGILGDGDASSSSSLGSSRGGEGRGRGGSVDDQVSGRLRAMNQSSGASMARGTGGKKKARMRASGGSEEVQFPDEMWDELLGRGYICGDERWLVGEDQEGRVTIARF